jgi:hypothetical protein
MRIFLVLPAFFLVGCTTATLYEVDVDSIAQKDTSFSKVFVIPISNDAPIVQQEFKTYVERALENQKFEIVDSIKGADLVITFNYGMKSSQEIRSSPTYDWVAPKAYGFEATTTKPYSQQSWNTSGTISEQGIGHLEQTGSETYTEWSHLRVIVIKAFEASDLREHEKKNPIELWQTTITSRGSSSDMRKVFPAMLAAGARALGHKTNGQIRVQIHEDAEPIKEITESRKPTGN